MTKLVKSLGIIVVAFALLAGAAVSTADALTQSEADAIIAALGLTGSSADVINALVSGGSSSGSSCDLKNSPDLTVGSTGANVVDLQEYLVSKGHLVMPAGVSMGYFGSLTQSALASYQSAMGISPAAGYFGPITRNSISCDSGSTGSTGSSSSTGLSGGAGSVDTYELSSSYNNEDVGEGEDDVEVLGLEVEVADESDLQILAVKIDFDYNGTGGSDDFDDYAKDVSVWLDGDKVAEVDADEFTEDNNYSRTVSLDDAVINAGDTEDIVVAVSGAKTIDSADYADAANDWDVDIESVRFKDAQGTVVSEDPSTAERDFEFESFADATDVEVRFEEDDKDINDAHVLDVDENDETVHSILSFTVDVDGDDVTIDDLQVLVTSVGFSLADGVSEFRLIYEGDEIDSKTASGATTTSKITFDDLDLGLSQGEHDFLLDVELNASSTAAFADGDTIVASIGADQRNESDIEDSNGDNLATGDRKGTVTGEALAIFDNAIDLTWVSDTGSKEVTVDSTNNDYVKLVLNFDVTNLGDDTLYIPDVVTLTGSSTSETRTAPSTAQGVGYSIQHSGLNMAYFPASSTSAVLTSSADKETSSFEVLSGQTETFKVEITVANATGALNDVGTTNVKGLLSGVGWADTDSATSDSVFTYDLDEFETDGFFYIAD